MITTIALNKLDYNIIGTNGLPADHVFRCNWFRVLPCNAYIIFTILKLQLYITCFRIVISLANGFTKWSNVANVEIVIQDDRERVQRKWLWQQLKGRRWLRGHTVIVTEYITATLVLYKNLLQSNTNVKIVVRVLLAVSIAVFFWIIDSVFFFIPLKTCMQNFDDRLNSYAVKAYQSG